jgi:hypothetical protein
MSKDSRILLAAIAISTLALAGLHFHLFNRLLTADALVAQSVNKTVQEGASNGSNGVNAALASSSATPSATQAQKTASASATVRPRATVTPTATPETAVEE